MQKGFTLIEVLVVVIIVAILSGIMVPAYFKGVERSRVAEAETIIGNVVNAQNRYFMRMNKYAENWRALDNAPHDALPGASYYTKGATGDGFWVNMQGGNNPSAKVTARRINGFRYNGYQLSRFYRGARVYCQADAGNKLAEEVCIEFGTEDQYIDPSASMAAEASSYQGRRGV